MRAMMAMITSSSMSNQPPESECGLQSGEELQFTRMMVPKVLGCFQRVTCFFSPLSGVAERSHDGSRGLQPMVGQREEPRRRATLESLAKSGLCLRACQKIPWGPVFAQKAGWQGASASAPAPRAYPQWSVSEEQCSQTAFCAKILRAAGLLSAASVGPALTAHSGDARAVPPWPQPKSLAAGPHAIFRQALSRRSATKTVTDLNRGLKPTATITSSLREEGRQPKPLTYRKQRRTEPSNLREA